MAVTTATFGLSPSTSTVIAPSDAERRRLYIKMDDGGAGHVVYLGDSTVDTTSGYPMSNGDELIIENSTPADCSAKNEFYAYTIDNAVTLHVMGISD